MYYCKRKSRFIICQKSNNRSTNKKSFRNLSKSSNSSANKTSFLNLSKSIRSNANKNESCENLSSNSSASEEVVSKSVKVKN